MLVVGIVGPPAGGKSTVASFLEELGSTWLNADAMAHETLEIDEVKEKLRNHFGSSVFNQENAVDRAALADRVFGPDPTNQRALEYIESVIHPVVTDIAFKRIRDPQYVDPLLPVVLDAPLLIEAGWHLMCDEILCVEAPQDLRNRWLEERGWDLGELHRREMRQLSTEIKQHHATRTITNDGDSDHLREQVVAVWDDIQSNGLATEQHC